MVGHPVLLDQRKPRGVLLRSPESAERRPLMSNAHPGRIVPQDVALPDGSGSMLTALPVSQAEIEELLYGDDRPPRERIERLQELAGQLREDLPGDLGDGDGLADSLLLLLEVDEAIARLQGDMNHNPNLINNKVSTD